MSSNEKNKKISKKTIIIIVSLVVLAIVTAVILCIVLGENVKEPEDIGTVVVTPIEEEVILSFSGVLSDNGEVLANTVVELHSDPMQTVTDEYGRFFFYDIEVGDHTLYVMDDSGTSVASVSLALSQSRETANGDMQKTNDGEYAFSLSYDVALLTLNLELYDDTLEVEENGMSTITYSQELTTSDGIFVADDHAIVTAFGSVILQDGSIIIYGDGIILSNGGYISADGTYYPPTEDESLPTGYAVTQDEDGTVQVETPNASVATFGEASSVVLPNGTQVNSDNTMTLVSGEVVEIDSESGAFILDESEYAGGEDTEEDGDDPYAGLSWVTLTPLESEDEEYIYQLAPNISSTNSADDWTADESGYISVNLFESWQEEYIYPGASGTYTFEVQNPNTMPMTCYMSIVDTSDLAIPFEYRLKTADGEYITPTVVESVLDDGTVVYATDESGENIYEWCENAELVLCTFLIEAGKSGQYILEWVWPATGNDALDTAIGSAENLQHSITITISASTAEAGD